MASTAPNPVSAAPPAPPVDVAAVMQHPEIQKAIQDAAAKAAAAAVSELTKSGGSLAGTDEATKNFFSQMALQIAEISDQGTNRKRVAPEILARRAEAEIKCRRLLDETRETIRMAKASGDRAKIDAAMPKYRVVAKVWFNERLIEPFRRNPVTKRAEPQTIQWSGMPNEGLRPMNGVAEKIYAEYKASIGSTERIATLDSRPFWITPEGRVVQGNAPTMLVVDGDPEQKPTVKADENFSDDLGVIDNNDPNAPFVNVLGSVADPARRTTVDIGKASARAQ